MTDGSGNPANLISYRSHTKWAADRYRDPGYYVSLESPAAGDLNAGKTVTLTLNLSEAVIVTGGTPTLSLNDGDTATYDAAHSTATALVFDYTVAAGDNIAEPGDKDSQSQYGDALRIAPAMRRTCPSPVSPRSARRSIPSFQRSPRSW